MIKQEGSTHIILVIVAVVLVIGVLGFVYWNNSTKDEQRTAVTQEAVVETEDVDTQEVENAMYVTYNGGGLVFEYPSKGWIEADKLDNETLARIQTTDYLEAISLGLESGADIVISETTQEIAPPQAAGVSNVTEIKVDIGEGYTYEVNYEGFRLQALLSTQGPAYIVTMHTASTPTDLEKTIFRRVLTTLKTT